MNTLIPDHRTRIDTLLESLASVFHCEDRPGGEMSRIALLEAKGHPFRTMPTTVLPEKLMDIATEQVGARPLAEVIPTCWHMLNWINWGSGTLADDVASKLYTTELVGPDGHFKDDRVRVGLLLSDSETDYPISSHSGEETYYVVTGTAEWSVGGGPYQTHKPGSLIHHPAWVPHGRRTLGEVFLGAWRWSGDLNLDSFRVAD